MDVEREHERVVALGELLDACAELGARVETLRVASPVVLGYAPAVDGINLDPVLAVEGSACMVGVLADRLAKAMGWRT